MKRKILLTSLIIFLTSAIFACNSTVETTEVPLSTDVIPIATLTQSAPSQITNTPAFTPTSELSWKTPPHPIPTLHFDLQDEFYNLLKTNGDCELPCILGIHPLETHWEDASTFLQKYSHSDLHFIDPYASTQLIRVHHANIDTNESANINADFRLEVESNQVVRIVLDLHVYAVGLFQSSEDYLTKYSLHEVFKSKGLPDAVYLKLIKGMYGLRVVYEKEKIAIEYIGSSTKITEGSYLICPNLTDGDISAITIALASPSDPVDIKSMLGSPVYDEKDTLERNAGMNPNDFYELLMSKKQPACFEASISQP